MSTILLLAALALPGWESLSEAPRWELQMLGVTDAARLEAVRAQVTDRLVTIAVVGIGGVSKAALRPHLYTGGSFYYRDGSADPGPGAHDTGQAAVILDLCAALGLRVRLASYQCPDDFPAVAAALASAGERADIVVCYHSFWGNNVRLITEAIASRPDCLFLVPYAEVGDRATSTSMQAHSHKPWGGGLANLRTCAPLAKRSDGSLLTPLNRSAEDSEIINFIAPSFHASGPGGTCPSVGVSAAVAAFAVAAAPERPRGETLAGLLERSVAVDEEALTSAPPFAGGEVTRLRASLQALAQPGPGGPRKLAAPGVLSLWQLRGALQ